MYTVGRLQQPQYVVPVLVDLCRALAVVIVVAFTEGLAHAAPIPVSMVVEVTSVESGITTVATGDRFTLDFTIETATVDVNDSIGSGRFPGLLTAVGMTAAGGNSGSWVPSGTFSVPASNFVTNAFGDNATFQVRGTGFPDGGPALPFFDIDLGFSFDIDVTDTGVGDTFGEHLAGFDLSQLASVLRPSSAIRFRRENGNFEEAVLRVVEGPAPPVVPEPATLMTLTAGLVGTLWRRRRYRDGMRRCQ